MMNDRLGFLPPDGGTKVVLFGRPALAAVGISDTRLREVIAGDFLSVNEEALVEWAHDLVQTILVADFEKGNTEEIEAMIDALEIAQEELDEQTAVLVVQIIRKSIESIDEQENAKEGLQ